MGVQKERKSTFLTALEHREKEARSLFAARGGGRHFHLGGATGGASFATRGAVSGLCRTSVQWHDVTRKILGGHWGGQAKFWGGSCAPWHPPCLLHNIFIAVVSECLCHL